MQKQDMSQFTPILIEVKDGRWNAFGHPPTPRSAYLVQALEAQGGVSEVVPEGLYDLNVLQVNGIEFAFMTPHIEL